MDQSLRVVWCKDGVISSGRPESPLSVTIFDGPAFERVERKCRSVRSAIIQPADSGHKDISRFPARGARLRTVEGIKAVQTRVETKDNSLLSGAQRRLWIGFVLALIGLSGCRAVLGPDGEAGSVALEQGCVAGTVECAGECVSTASSDQHCGGCNVACSAGEFCDGGACATFCAQGTTDCGGACLVTSSDRANCGGCGVACSSGEYCDSGTCDATCSGTVCTTPGGDDCVHLEENNDHCGACGNACGPGKSCQNGTCTTACADGRLACNGLCVDVRSNSSNCGACGNACEAGVACVEGDCGGQEPVCTGGSCTCSSTQEYCNEACVNAQSNPLHCGGCGIECLEGQLCTAGSCACPAAEVVCGQACTDPKIDDKNCGTCGTVCQGGTSCQAGTCVCDAGQDLCDDTCVDLKTDPAHCGVCGTACESYEECVAGICKYDADQCGGDARNISISRVALYQAVEIDLFDGELVQPGERNADVVQNREALVRVFVSPAAGFSSREISARIFIENEGDIQVFHQKKVVSGASSQNDLASTFLLDVPADVLEAETKYWIELAECGPLPTGSVGTVRVPPTPGINADFAARQTGVIKVVFVPVVHDGRTPDVSPATIEAYAREVAKLYPTTGVEASVRGGITSNQSGTSVDLGSTLDLVTDRRADDGVAGDVYYYGLIDPASSFNNYCNGGCTTGIGWVPDAGGFWADDHRAAVGIGFGTRGVGTFSHELGHNHGRNHAPCGGASGADGSYPYSGALIGSWGYDRDEQELLDPANHRDFMSYCDPSWVSDYTYQAFLERIASLNGSASSQANVLSVGPMQTWYRMVVTTTGARWSSPARGPAVPGSGSEKGTVLDVNGSPVALVDVYRIPMSHDGGFMLYVPEPQPGWHAIGPVGGPYLAY